MDICGLGGWLTRKQLTSRPDHAMARTLEINGKARQAKGEAKSGLRKSSILKAHENCVGSISSTPRIRNSKKPSRTHVRSWKHQWLLLCPVKLWKNCGSGASNKIKTKLACILEADESTRMRMGNSIPHNHEDHIAGKGGKFITALQLGSQIYSYASSCENSGSKSSGWTRNGKIGENFGVELDKSQKLETGWSRNQGRRALQFILHHIMDICHLKNAELEAKHQKYKGSSCTPWWYCKRRFRVLRSIYWSRIFSISNDSRQNHGYHLQFAWLRMDKQQTQYQAFTQGESGRCFTNYWKIPKSECPDMWIRLTTTQMAENHGPVWKTQSFLLKRICMVILWQDCFGKGNLRKILLKHGWERGFQIGNVSLFNPWKRIVLICVCGWHKIGWKEATHWSDVETTQQRSRFGRTNIFPWSCILGVPTQRQCQVSKDVVDNYRSMFESRISAGGVEKLPFPQNLRIYFMVLWHGWSCKESVWNKIVSWQTGRLNNPTKYLLHASMTPLQRRRNEICWRIVTCMLSNGSEMLILGKNWTTWYSMVSK